MNEDARPFFTSDGIIMTEMFRSQIGSHDLGGFFDSMCFLQGWNHNVNPNPVDQESPKGSC